MAEVSHGGITQSRKDRLEVSWANVTESDTFEAVDLTNISGVPAVVVMQAEDTFGGATLALHGSADGTNFRALADKFGTEIGETAVGIVQSGEAAKKYKPVASGGTSQSLDVTLLIYMV